MLRNEHLTRTMAFCIGIVANCLEDKAEQLQQCDNQGSERDGAQRERRRAAERRQRWVWWLQKCLID